MAKKLMIVEIPKNLSVERVHVWATDFENMQSGGWAAEYAAEARIIRGLQKAKLIEAGKGRDVLDAVNDLGRLEAILDAQGAQAFYEAIVALAAGEPCPEPFQDAAVAA